MLDVQAKTIEPTHEFQGRSRASANDADRISEFPLRWIFFEGVENGNPNRGNATGDGHALADHQFQNALWIDVRTGKHEARTKHGRGKRDAPGVGMEHRRNGQDGIRFVHSKHFHEAATEGVQNNSAVGVDDAFGKPSRTRGEAHGRAVIFVNRRIAKISIGIRQEIFIVQRAFGNGVATVRRHDHAFKRNVLPEFFVNGIKHVVNQKKPVARMLGDGGDFLRVKAKVQRVQDAAGTGNSEKSLQMARVVPHHGSNAISGLESKSQKRRRKAAGPVIEFPIASTNDRLVGLSRNNFDPRENFPGTLQDGGKRQRKIHHCAAHRASRTGHQTGES